MRSQIEANLIAVWDRISAASARADRDAKDIKLIAVSKTHPAEVLSEAIDAGTTAFGENKVQEADGKITELGRNSAEWHLIGHLQSNKARRAVQLFDVIHSVDSVELARRLERICAEEGRETLPVLLQIDLGGEATKAGFPEQEVAAAVDFLGSCERLKLIGLMTLPPFFDDAELTRPFFKRLRVLRDEYIPGGGLSMGMSHDLEPAIEEGATMVRIGTAIFGSRG